MQKYILIIFFLMFLFYRMGILVKNILKTKKDSFYSIVLNGFILTIAIFEIMCLPYNLLRLNVKSLYYISISVYSCLTILSFITNKTYYKQKVKELKELKNSKDSKGLKNVNLIKTRIIDKFKTAGKKEIIITILLITSIALQITMSTYLQSNNADDSFYLSWSQEAKQLENNLVEDPSTGQANSVFSQMYRLNSWEIFNGFVARFFNVKTAILNHTIYQILFILLSYMSYYLLCKKLDKTNAKKMTLLLSIIFLFSGFSIYFRGYFLILRIWQGKTILLNILMPYILTQLVDLHLTKERIIKLIIANIASIALNPISIWMFPFIYFSFAVIMMFKRRIKSMFKMVIVIIPYLIILPIYFKLAIGGGKGTINITYYKSYIEVLKNVIGQGYLIIALYVISLIYVFIKGNKRSKNVFIFMPIILYITIINPLITNYVQKYITASATYWRVYWLIPCELTIAYSATTIIRSINKKYLKIIIGLAITLVIVLGGKNMYLESGEFSKHINDEKIPQFIVDETEFIMGNSKDKVLVLAPTEPLHGQTMRQLTSDVILLISRQHYAGSIENYDEKKEMYDKVYNQTSKEVIYEAFDKYDLDYIIVEKENKDKIDLLDTNYAKIVFEDDYYIIIANTKSDKILNF